MNFIRYNPDTGEITTYGYMEEKFIQQEIDEGKPTLFADNIYDFTSFKVNLQTKQIIAVGATAP